MKTNALPVLALLVCGVLPATSQEQVRKPKTQVDWLCDWQQALAEAKRTERPIMLAFGAPSCEGVPGLW